VHSIIISTEFGQLAISRLDKRQNNLLSIRLFNALENVFENELERPFSKLA
jgi:hypothetical protein